MKHFFNQNKIRILIILISVILLWQLITNWPDANLGEVSKLIAKQIVPSNAIQQYKQLINIILY